LNEKAFAVGTGCCGYFPTPTLLVENAAAATGNSSLGENQEVTEYT